MNEIDFKIIVHKHEDKELFYLVDREYNVIAKTAYYADAFTDTMSDDKAKEWRLDQARRQLIQKLVYIKTYYDDTKECKEFLNKIKLDQIKKDFEDERNIP